MMQKRWTILDAAHESVQQLGDELKINPYLCKILVQRGINDFEKAKAFFRPGLETLHDPLLMKDMDKAVCRISKAVQGHEKILVFGDYDVDGTASVACMIRFLRKFYHPEFVDFYIPDRYKEGYGISRIGIDYAAENGFTLVISVDCGIKSIELVAYASQLGIEFIICDHHLPDKELPHAIAILNPKQEDCNYPYKELCGCGVAFKLITALCRDAGMSDEDFLCYLDLVATAIAADIVPITGENRVLAYFGLKKINEDPCQGIKALVKLSKIEKKFTINNVVFIIAPRVNAAGRMDDARTAVRLFIEDDISNALDYAEKLQINNIDRREADLSTTEEALAMIGDDQSLVNRNSTVVFNPSWHKGVVGIVASRLIEKYYRPTIVLTRSGDLVTGSARSITGFNLYEAIHACREHLLGYGGHFAAAGLSMMPDKVEGFSKKFEEMVTSTCEPHLLTPEIVIDCGINFTSASLSFYNILSQMEPFGPGNMRPVFIASNVEETGYSRIVKEIHIRFVLKQNGKILTGIGFNLAEKFSLLQSNKPLQIVFTLEENEWEGNTSIQLKIIDLRLQ